MCLCLRIGWIVFIWVLLVMFLGWGIFCVRSLLFMCLVGCIWNGSCGDGFCSFLMFRLCGVWLLSYSLSVGSSEWLVCCWIFLVVVKIGNVKSL